MMYKILSKIIALDLLIILTLETVIFQKSINEKLYLALSACAKWA